MREQWRILSSRWEYSSEYYELCKFDICWCQFCLWGTFTPPRALYIWNTYTSHMCPYHMLLVLFLYKCLFLTCNLLPPNIYPHFKHDHTQSEIDTHLNIIHIESTSLYDQYSSTSDALTAMRNQFQGSSWHYQGMDLHTALLGNMMGGGIAYLGVLCSEYIMTSHALD